jgi:hypothetical protein
MKTIGIYCVIVPLMTMMTSASYGQRPLRRYMPPAGPTITPYLNYYRADLSTLPSSYQSFIVPQEQAQRNLYELSRNQQADFRKIEGQIKEVRASSAAPTGVGATFLNYSHYYRLPQGGTRRN